MLAKRLVNTIDLDKSVWLDYRRKGISGSDLGAICNLNKWKSPVTVYLEKVGELPSEQEDNEFMLWGRVLEPVIAEEFKRRNPGYKVKKINAILQHPQYQWALGNVDREIIDENGERGILEIKTVSEYGKDQWKDENIPDAYAVQLQWYLFVTGYKYGWFAALCGGNKYIQKRVERDDELIANLVAIAEDFWCKVLTHTLPSLDGSEASTSVLNAIYKVADENKPTVQLESSIESIIEERENLKAEVKKLEEKINFAENTLKSLIGEAEAAETQNYVVIWKNVKGREGIDTKKLKTEMPEVYKKYNKAGNGYRQLTVKRKVE